MKSRLLGGACALSVLGVALLGRPFAEMPIADDWSYLRSAQVLVETGHVVYNGWATAMLGWQLFMAAAVYKLFGFSFTGPRMAVLAVGAITAFFVHRSFARLGLNARNASIATLAFALSPLYLVLSTSFMTDIPGLFALVVCLYACIRAVQARTDAAACSWLVAAVTLNALCGTARQIAWLGVLILVPSTLWLLRGRRKVLVVGSIATVAGVAFIFAALHWFTHQPRAVAETLLFTPTLALVHRGVMEMIRGLLFTALLTLPVLVLFLPAVRRLGRMAWLAIGAVVLAYAGLAFRWRLTRPDHLVQPTLGDWMTPTTIYGAVDLVGTPPVVLPYLLRSVITAVVLISLLVLIASVVREWKTRSTQPLASTPAAEELSEKTVWILLGPVTVAYILFLVRRSTFSLYDRYMLFPAMIVLLLCALYYQRRWQARLPNASLWLTALFAAAGLLTVHNQFSFYRARVTLANEVLAAGVPEASTDLGWEQNSWYELQHAPATFQKKTLAACHVWLGPVPYHPARYAVSFQPDLCEGPGPFAPVPYSLWGSRQPASLYVVRYAAPGPTDADDLLRVTAPASAH